MTGTVANDFFSGWIGFGTALASGTLSEPADAAYARRPILLGPLFNGQATERFPGTIGPAATAWGPLSYAGLFNAAAGGSLLACWLLARPVTVAAGRTWTSSGQFGLTLAGDPATSPLTPRNWVAGSQVGTVSGGRPVVACQNLQLSGGQLVLIGTTSPSLSSASALPSTSPASGSGQLWNNGGVICVA